MILLTTSDRNLKKSFLVLNDKDYSIEKEIPYQEELDSKIINTYEGKDICGNIIYSNRKDTFNPYGITCDENNIYISSNEIICSFYKKNFKYNKVVSKTGCKKTKNILYHNGYIYRCDTAVNCITKININTLEEIYIDAVEQKIIDKLPDSDSLSHLNFNNINSLYIENNILYINCNNYINFLSDENEEKLKNYKKLRDLSNEEYNELLKKTNENYIDDEYSLLKKIMLPQYLNFSYYLTFNIETNKFNKKANLIKSRSHKSLIVVNDIVWSCCPYRGSLIKKTKIETIEFNLVDKNIYSIKGLYKKKNKLYIFACIRKEIIEEKKYNDIKSKVCIFYLNTEKIEYKDLPDKIKVINNVLNI